MKELCIWFRAVCHIPIKRRVENSSLQVDLCRATQASAPQIEAPLTWYLLFGIDQ